jgi:hypothetical protein
VRASPDAELEAVLVLTTLGAPQRRLLARRGRRVEGAQPEPVPTSRASVVRPEPFATREAAEEWAARGAEDERVEEALQVLNRALHAHRVSAYTSHPADLPREAALVVRLGYGDGEAVAAGRYVEARELPSRARRTKRSMEAPEERFAAILAGREATSPAEELVLRARADLDAGRDQEAALGARVALEALLAERAGAGAAAGLEADRGSVGEAANAALRGPLDAGERERLRAAIVRMETALRRRRLGA